jgi:Fe/S biogenesis protein NfuA
MLTFTDRAREKVVEAMQAEGKDDLALRLTIEARGPGGTQYGLSLIGPDEASEDDTIVDAGAFKVHLDPTAAGRLGNASVDFIETISESGFKVENADEAAHWDDPTAQKIQQLIDERINPGVASHGGWVELLGVKDDTAFLRLGGGCQGCGMVDVTLKQGIEVMIKEEIPQIARVIDQTDHAGGKNPYYQPTKG